MYQIVICDDEKENLKEICEKVKESFKGQKLEANYVCMHDSRELMDYIQREPVDVLFLDIDMPYFNGMDIAGFINEKGYHTLLVFVTSHDALVYQTFAYRPFGFIRKTYMKEEILELTKRVQKELMERRQELIVSKGSESVRIRIADLVYIEAEGNYLNLYTKQESLKVRETMTSLEQKLYGKGFIRCHKGYLINADYIGKWKSTEIEIMYGTEKRMIPVGRSYKKDARRRIIELMRD